MKIKGLLFGVLTCAALLACTNDDIVESNGNQPQTEELENVPAYITVSIGTTNSSSRAEVNGDQHENTEDSGHENGGTENENAINDIAVIIKSFAKDGITVATNSGVATVIGKDAFTTSGTEAEQVITIKSSFKVLAGRHSVLTIVNPTTEIKTAINNIAANNYGDISALYDALAGDGNLSVYGLGYDKLASCGNAIMFLNRNEVSIEANSANTEGSPALASIQLERPVAKIMYRGVKANNSYPIDIEITRKDYNIVYKDDDTDKKNPYALVQDAAGRIRAVKVEVKTGSSQGFDKDYVDYTMKLTSGVPDECYAYDKTTGIVGNLLTPIVLTGDITAIPEDNYYLKKDNDGKWIAPEFVFTSSKYKLGGDAGGWKVDLTAYALINLTKNSYVIRHIADGLGNNVKTFGFLDGQNYIADPFFTAKNTASKEYTFAKYSTWGDNEWKVWNKAAEKWFNNTLKAVANETAGIPNEDGVTYLAALPADNTGANPEHNPSAIGALLQYSFENGVTAENQLHGLTTGIVFKGKVTGNEELPTMYQYGTEVYIDLNEIVKAYGPANKDIAAIGIEMAKTENYATTEVGKTAIKAAGIKIYAEGECYYYTNQIKHFDNGDNNVAGNMEFAIVRNNIYSLAVTDIKGIGDAAINPDPSIENETTIAYIKVEAKKVPWSVRFNNIEF